MSRCAYGHVAWWLDLIVCKIKCWPLIKIGPIGGMCVQVATPDQAQEVHAYIRKWLADRVSPKVSGATRIIYGEQP